MLTPVKTDLMPAEKGAGVSLWYVAMRLALSGRAGDFVVKHVRLLCAFEGFPPPLPDYILGSRKRRVEVHVGSRWARPAVDAWFDGQVPPELAAAAAALAHGRDAALLDARAQAAAAA